MMASAPRAEPTTAMTTENNIQTCLPRIRAAALTRQDAGDDVFPFKHFDVVQSPQDHHYLDTKEQVRKRSVLLSKVLYDTYMSVVIHKKMVPDILLE